MSSIRLNGKIWHICIDLQDQKLINQLCGFMRIKSHVHSLGLIDSKIDIDSMGLICKVLEDASVSKKEK